MDAPAADAGVVGADLNVQYVLSDRPDGAHFERWTGTQRIEAGRGAVASPDVVVTRTAALDAADDAGDASPEAVAAGTRLGVRLPDGTIVDDVFPPPPEVRHDLDVFDPAQQTSARVRCLASPFGDVTFDVAVRGPGYTIAPGRGDVAAELEFDLEFGYFLHWLHLGAYLGPALWRSGSFGGSNVFLLSLLDGVVAAGSAAKGRAHDDLLAAITRLRWYATCRRGRERGPHAVP